MSPPQHSHKITLFNRRWGLLLHLLDRQVLAFHPVTPLASGFAPSSPPRFTAFLRPTPLLPSRVESRNPSLGFVDWTSPPPSSGKTISPRIVSTGHTPVLRLLRNKSESKICRVWIYCLPAVPAQSYLLRGESTRQSRLRVRCVLGGTSILCLMRACLMLPSRVYFTPDLHWGQGDHCCLSLL